MKNNAIIAKAIRTAILKGFDIYGEFHSFYMDQITAEPKVMFMSHGLSYSYSLYSIIFSPSFAKALWGDKLCRLDTIFTGFDGPIKKQSNIKYWQYHLQQMVISDYPIKYLGDNI